jgi:hypothetical protein
MAIKDWSTTAASNNSAPPDGFPENMAPSAVNDAARETMAQVRSWYEDAEWINRGYTYAYVAATQFKVAGSDVTSIYPVGRRVRAVGSSTGTIYGTITASSFSSDTTVTVAWDSGTLANETLQISHGAATNSLPGAVISEDDWTIQGNLTVTGNQTFTGNQTVTGTLEANGSVIHADGGNVASASNLALGTGNFFDVTGTTNITSIDSVGVGAFATLQFDGALTLTHHATDLVLPSAANITTAAGDIAQFYEYASGDWRCISYTKADGTALAVAAAGADYEFVNEETVGASDAAIQFVDLSSGYDHIFTFNHVGPATDNAFFQLRTSPDTGASPTFDTGASDYHYVYTYDQGNTVYDYAETYMRISANNGNADGEEINGEIVVYNPVAAEHTRFVGNWVGGDSSSQIRSGISAGYRQLAETVNAVQFLWSSGNFKASQGSILHYRRKLS